MSSLVLEVKDLRVSFGGVHVLQGVDLLVSSNPISLIGRNGMGKTTLCQAIMGLAPVSFGSIKLHGEEITSLRTNQIAQRGIGYVPQGRRVFPSLTVEEHLRLAFDGKRGRRWTVDTAYELFHVSKRDGQMAERNYLVGSSRCLPLPALCYSTLAFC